MIQPPNLRTNTWLNEQLQNLLSGAFSDMKTPNTITIKFGQRARRRLGSIRMSRDKKQSRIIINGYLRDPAIPEQIISSVIAHELCHYAHGFCSPLPKKYQNPHAGGIIGREFKKRGLYLLLEFEKQWTKNHWTRIVGYGRVRRSFSPKVYSVPGAINLLSRLFR